MDELFGTLSKKMEGFLNIAAEQGSPSRPPSVEDVNQQSP